MGDRTGIMLCYPFEEKRLSKWGYPVLVQPKLDGDRCRAFINSDRRVKLLSSEGNERVMIPHINEALSSLAPDHGCIQLDGELYIHTEDHSKIHGIASRTVNMADDFDRMAYWIFDIIVDVIPQDVRLDTLKHILRGKTNKHVVRCPTYVAESLDDIMDWMDTFIKEGFEGIIVRRPGGLYKPKRSTDIMKFKPHKVGRYHIIGFKEEVSIDGDPKGRLGALLCVVPSDPFEDEDKTFAVGTGPILTAEGRQMLWDRRQELPGRTAIVKYQNTTNGGVPRFPVLEGIA